MANGRRVAFVPPAGAVQEFKVETATFDAQQGHTAGATVNVTLKSGTNRVRGDAYYHYRDEVLSANDFFLERAGRPKDDTGYKRYGFTAGGPVVARQALRRPRQDLLLHGLRVALRHVPRARSVHGADRGAAQRRLLGAALAGHRHLRSADRACAAPTAASSASRSPATSFPANRISPIGRELHELLPDAQPGRATRRAATTTSPPTRAATTSTR